MALKRHAAVCWKAEIVMMESQVRDSTANGAAERAVISWAGQLRTIRDHVGRRIKMTIPQGSVMMSWLVSWAVDVIFRYKFHPSGRTSPEWITGHRYDQPVAGFGKKIHFKLRPTTTTEIK